MFVNLLFQALASMIVTFYLSIVVFHLKILYADENRKILYPIGQKQKNVQRLFVQYIFSSS